MLLDQEEFIVEYNIIISIYYMALSHKDWELPNSRIWLAEMDIDRGLDFPIYTGISGPVMFWSEKVEN